ncbi:hypothetical protein P3H15_32120 [Rhodococcus sp. T2V]|uniref:hypothetical protein n=1 Tax=Rhodococcus sp. T2V TaxID=3034164 RepID=UPI0023E33975|nr:hypothetical protein [Rhodococcus sp. T2V]MDF3309666.1 hypothetical protein [Rhodococcus sp. T2V]
MTGLVVALPLALVELARSAGYSVGTLLPDALAIGDATGVLVAIAVSAAVLVVVCTVAAVGWAGGIHLLTGSDTAGKPVGVKDAFRHGLGRLPSLVPWTLGVAVLLVAGLAAFVVPGLYVLFALSLFSFPVLFEPGANPLRRSFALTHTRGAGVLARFGVLAVVAVVFESALSLFFAGVSWVLLGRTGLGASGHGLSDGVIDAVHTVVGAPVWALLVTGLTVTYAELRAQESEKDPERNAPTAGRGSPLTAATGPVPGRPTRTEERT